MAFETVLIRSTRNGSSPIVATWREDLIQGDLVGLTLFDEATSAVPTGVTTYLWQVIGRPEYSVAGGGGTNPWSLGTAASASFVVDADSGSVKLDGTYTVQCVINAGAPSETRITAILARLSGQTIPGEVDPRPLRKQGGYESLQDMSVAEFIQGWALQENRWHEAIRILMAGGPSPGPPGSVQVMLTNGDGVILHQGDIVRVSAGNTVIRARGNLTGLYADGKIGVVSDTTIGIGSTGLVALVGVVPVRFLGGLTLAARDAVYVSATDGLAVNAASSVVPPAPIGVVVSAATYGGGVGDPALVALQFNRRVLGSQVPQPVGDVAQRGTSEFAPSENHVHGNGPAVVVQLTADDGAHGVEGQVVQSSDLTNLFVAGPYADDAVEPASVLGIVSEPGGIADSGTGKVTLSGRCKVLAAGSQVAMAVGKMLYVGISDSFGAAIVDRPLGAFLIPLGVVVDTLTYSSGSSASQLVQIDYVPSVAPYQTSYSASRIAATSIGTPSVTFAITPPQNSSWLIDVTAVAAGGAGAQFRKLAGYQNLGGTLSQSGGDASDVTLMSNGPGGQTLVLTRVGGDIHVVVTGDGANDEGWTITIFIQPTGGSGIS